MTVFFQCLGITGVIFIFYGLVAFAVTQAQTWFFWSLVITGVIFLALFIFKTLSRQWQVAIGLLLVLNAPWILIIAGSEWPLWVQLVSGGVALICFAGLAFRRVAPNVLGISVSALAAGYGALLYFRQADWGNFGNVYFLQADWVGYDTLVLALVGNGLFGYLSRFFLRDLFEKRAMKHGTNALIYTSVIAAIIALANLMSQRDFNTQIDLTEQRINTLSEQSIKVIQSLKEPVQVKAFFDDRNRQKPFLKNLLEMYRYQSKNVEFEFVDPDREKELAETHKATDGDILVQLGKEMHTTQDVSEQGITQAIMKVTRTGKSVVCFTKGHGELDIDGEDQDSRSLAFVREAMENEGFQPRGVDSILEEGPQDCAVLVVAGPKQAFVEAEAKAIDEYLAKGGDGLFLLDPNIPAVSMTGGKAMIIDSGLEETLKKWGVELGRDLIITVRMELFRGATKGLTLAAFDYGNHPIVDPLKGRQTVFQSARSLKINSAFSGTTLELIRSPERASWAETNVNDLFLKKNAEPDANDTMGPVLFGVVADKEQPKKGGTESAQGPTRVVVLGDSDFVSNAMLQSYGFNLDLLLNSLNWMRGEAEKISIRPKRLSTSVIELTPKQSNMVFYVAIIGLPMLVLIFGMDLWWYRRRRG